MNRGKKKRRMKLLLQTAYCYCYDSLVFAAFGSNRGSTHSEGDEKWADLTGGVVSSQNEQALALCDITKGLFNMSEKRLCNVGPLK